jgi:hypothetical protein
MIAWLLPFSVGVVLTGVAWAVHVKLVTIDCDAELDLILSKRVRVPAPNGGPWFNEEPPMLLDATVRQLVAWDDVLEGGP